MDKPLDYSRFSEMEINVLKAITTNNANRADIEPLFPALEHALKALIGQIEQADDVFLVELLQLSKEVNLINKYLLKALPKTPKEPDIIAQMDNDEVIQLLLIHGIINNLVKQLNTVRDSAFNRALEATGNSNGVNQWQN